MGNEDRRAARRRASGCRTAPGQPRAASVSGDSALAFQGIQEPPQLRGAAPASRTPRRSAPLPTTASPASHTQERRPTLRGWGNPLPWLRSIERSPRGSDGALLVVWAITRLLLLLSVIVGHAYTDPQFYHYAGQLAVGQFPFRDIPVEYPPLAMVLVLLPALPLLLFPAIAPRPDAAFLHVTQLPHPVDPTRYAAYAISFAVEMLVIDVVTLWLVRRAARRLAPGDANGLRAGLFYLALTFASGALLQKFDIIVGTLCLAAVVALLERRRGLAWSLLAAAALVKGFPLLVVGLGVALFGGPGSLIHAVVSQTGRDFEIESLYANLMLALGWLPGWLCRRRSVPPYSHGSRSRRWRSIWRRSPLSR